VAVAPVPVAAQAWAAPRQVLEAAPAAVAETGPPVPADGLQALAADDLGVLVVQADLAPPVDLVVLVKEPEAVDLAAQVKVPAAPEALAVPEALEVLAD